MLSSHRFSYFPLLVTVALMISCCCCIEAPAQTPSPESDLPPWWRFCEFLSANLTLMSSGEPAHSSITLPDGRNLTRFGQSSFAVPAGLSSPSSFTFTTHDKRGLEPSLAFIFASYPLRAVAPSCVQYMELRFFCKRDLRSCEIPPVIALCTPPQQVPQAQDVPSTLVDEDSQTDEVSLAYDASTAELRVQVVDHRMGLKSKVMFNLSTHNFMPDSHESTFFFVGYISSGEASIKVAPSPPLSPPPGIEESTIPTHNYDSLPKNDTHKTNHTKVIVGVVMGALGIGTLLGFIIPALLIKKRHGRRPLVNSPTPGHPIPLVVRSPFTHDDLDSGVAPMMSTPPFPPIRSDAFQQTSGSTSWLQPINPR